MSQSESDILLVQFRTIRKLSQVKSCLALCIYRVVQKKGTVLLSTSLWWLAATGQKLSLNLAPFLLLNPVHIGGLSS